MPLAIAAEDDYHIYMLEKGRIFKRVSQSMLVRCVIMPLAIAAEDDYHIYVYQSNQKKRKSVKIYVSRIDCLPVSGLYNFKDW